MWKADVNIIAFDSKSQQVCFFKSLLGPTRESVWDESATWVGEIAVDYVIVSLYVEVTNLSN
jgi:hypothetical protein